MAAQKPVEAPVKAVALEPGDPIQYPAALGATFAERKAAREKREAEAKQVGRKQAENKAVTAADKK